MKRLLSLSMLPLVLAACSPLTEIPPEPGQPGPGAPAAEGPLVVPPLSALPDTRRAPWRAGTSP
ncbi:hypothetical protein AD428_09210 [Achromobacter sp. DMS1]|nr:hypothetical protein AD428_09210 [Achromobacter sp. DMS1]